MNNETKKGKLVPELRFPGFEGEWEVKKLGNLCNITMGQSPSSEYYNTNGIGMPLIQGNADFNGRKSIIRNYTSQITKSCKKGDVILTVRAPVGAVGIASYDSCIGRGVCALKNAHQYLYQYLLSIEDSWEKYSAGSTFTCVNSDVLSSIPIPLPVHKAEQQKIAECLSSVDNLIQAEADQLQALKDHKKGLMQQLFPQEGETTPKLRFLGFEGKWEEKKLGEIGIFSKGKGISKAETNPNGVTPCIRYGELYTKYGEQIYEVFSMTNL
nr:restriction endonuclease subunit S [Bacteroidales bacterium]